MSEAMDGKVAVVTGAGSGIGRATVLAFARQGARVVVADVDEAGGRGTVDLVAEAGGEAVFVKVDVSDGGDVARMVATAAERFGRLDYAHNNAGIMAAGGSVADYAEDAWHRTLAVNLTGVFLCMKHEIPLMLQSGGGAIVNTSSRAGLVGVPGICAYVATKHAVAGLTKSAAIEYARQGIRVNAVAPGPIRTGMSGFGPDGEDESGQAELLAEMVKDRPMPRLGMPNEVAEAVVWLCSDAASYVTGHVLAVDGGSLAR